MKLPLNVLIFSKHKDILYVWDILYIQVVLDRVLKIYYLVFLIINKKIFNNIKFKL